MTTIAPSTIGHALSARPDSTARIEAVAKEVVKTITSYGREPSPPRPSLVEEVGLVYVASLYDRLRRGQRLVSAERELLALFGLWRSALWEREGVSAGRLVLLASVHETCTDRAKADDASPWAAARKRVRTFVAHSYGAQRVPTPRGWAVESWSLYYAQDLSALPLWFRLGREPPEEQRERERGKAPAYRKMSADEAYGKEDDDGT